MDILEYIKIDLKNSFISDYEIEFKQITSNFNHLLNSNIIECTNRTEMSGKLLLNI